MSSSITNNFIYIHFKSNLLVSNRSGIFSNFILLSGKYAGKSDRAEVTMHEIPSIECVRMQREVSPIRSNFAASPIEIPIELYLLWRISFSSPSSLSSLPPSFVRVLARHVIVPYLAADGRADLRGRRYLLPFHFSFEKKSDVVLSQFRCKHFGIVFAFQD